MTDSNRYFVALGRGEKIKTVEEFTANIHHLETTIGTPRPISNIISQFWMASRAASLIPELNEAATAKVTREANRFLAKELQKFPVLVEDDEPDITAMGKLLSTYFRLQTVPTDDFVTTWIAKSKDILATADAQTLLYLPNQLARLSIYPGDEWMEEWWRASAAISGKWSVEEGFGLTYKLALLDFLRKNDSDADLSKPSPCKEVADKFLSHIENRLLSKFTNYVDSRVYYAAKWFGYDILGNLPVQPEKKRTSRLEEKFVTIATGAGIAVNTEGILITESGHRIDLGLMSGQAAASEIDGVGHFNRASLKQHPFKSVAFNVTTRFQSWLTAELRPDMHVLRIPYFHLDGNEQNLPWAKTLRRLTSKEPGVYAYHGGSIVRNMADANGHHFPGQTL